MADSLKAAGFNFTQLLQVLLCETDHSAEKGMQGASMWFIGQRSKKTLQVYCDQENNSVRMSPLRNRVVPTLRRSMVRTWYKFENNHMA